MAGSAHVISARLTPRKSWQYRNVSHGMREATTTATPRPWGSGSGRPRVPSCIWALVTPAPSATLRHPALECRSGKRTPESQRECRPPAALRSRTHAHHAQLPLLYGCLRGALRHSAPPHHEPEPASYPTATTAQPVRGYARQPLRREASAGRELLGSQRLKSGRTAEWYCGAINITPDSPWTPAD
jgi:hypothetical protein